MSCGLPIQTSVGAVTSLTTTVQKLRQCDYGTSLITTVSGHYSVAALARLAQNTPRPCHLGVDFGTSFSGNLPVTPVLTGQPIQTATCAFSATGVFAGETPDVGTSCYVFDDDFSDGTCTAHTAPRWGDLDWAVAAVNRIDTKSCGGAMTATWEAGDGASGGKAVAFSTYATSGVNAVIDSATQMSEGKWTDTSGSDATHSISSGPALCISGNFNAGNTSCYTAQVFSVDTHTIILYRFNNGTLTTLVGTGVTPSVNDRIALTFEDLSSKVRLKVYQNGTLVYTYDDSSASRLTTFGMGFVAIRVAPNASNFHHSWDDWTCAATTLS